MSKLIGTNPNQVPSNADLGTAAFMDKEELLLSGDSRLEAISSRIDEATVHAVVYDTRCDSDGGAWRKRCRHLSWYNEELNTEVRGSRREFPSVAILVLKSNSSGTEGVTDDLIIYDGDDPNFPMWMKVRFVLGSGTNQQVAAKNGVISFCATNNGILIMNLLRDQLRVHNHVHRHTYSNVYPSRLGRTSSRRSLVISAETGYSLLGERVYGIAMDVHPNAVIDPKTQLEVPTIACATEFGLGVIKSDETVLNKTGGSSYDTCYRVALDGRFGIVKANSWYAESNAGFFTIADVEDANAGFQQWNSRNNYNSGYGPVISNNIATNGGPNKYYGMSFMRDGRFAQMSYDGNLNGNPLVQAKWDVHNRKDSMVNWIAKTYNTGWMFGNVLTCVLSSTEATELNPREEVTNASFGDGTTGWTLASASEGSISASGGNLTLNNTTAADPPVSCYQALNLTPGKWYNLRAKKNSGLEVAVNIVETAAANGGTGGYGNVVYSGDLTASTSQDMSCTFRANETSNYIQIRVNTNTTGTTVMEYVSIKECDPPRDWRGQWFARTRQHGMNVEGAIKRTPVAKGADLVGYHGWGSANYMWSKPDLDYSTEDFYFTFWIKPDGSDTNDGRAICGFGDWDANNGFLIYLKYNSGSYQIDVGHLGSAASFLYNIGSSAPPVQPDTWNHVVLRRVSGNYELYINGEYGGYNWTAYPSNWSSFWGDSSDQSQVNILSIGCRANAIAGGHPSRLGANDHLALLRTGNNGTLTPEKIKWMYGQERKLFAENAKCTIYGDPNTDESMGNSLGYDWDNDLLHIGTSAGRSVFQGLLRVDNTTKNHYNCVSVSNGLVVED